MQRLSGLDASFLYLETAAQPLHVCSILELDTSTMPGGYTFDRLRDGLTLRIKAMPEFREKLADNRFNLDHPVWVEDRDFDVARHVHRIGLPSPGGRIELAEICGHIASLPLDRTRPLWEMWVIENVGGTGNGTADSAGRIAVMTKVHHASVDGVTGANLMSKLCSTEPDAPPPDPVDGPGDASDLEIAISGAPSRTKQPSTTRAPIRIGIRPVSAAKPTSATAITHRPTARLPDTRSVAQATASASGLVAGASNIPIPPS